MAKDKVKKGKKVIRGEAKHFIESIRVENGDLHIKLYNHWGLGVLVTYGSPDTHLILNPVFDDVEPPGSNTTPDVPPYQFGDKGVDYPVGHDVRDAPEVTH